MITLDTLQRWLTASSEVEQLEFKEAKQQFDSHKRMRSCVALDNTRGKSGAKPSPLTQTA